MSTLHSLLIGIDHYFAYQLDAAGAHFPKLGGCVRYLRDVELYLLI